MELISWTAAAYLLLLPAGYALDGQHTKRVEGPGGLGSTIETFCRWRDAAGRTIDFHWWDRYPPRPGGPMVTVRETRGTWAGASATFVETRVFQGAPARLAVAFQDVVPFGAQARIAATGLGLKQLEELLAMASLRDLAPARASDAGCRAVDR